MINQFKILVADDDDAILSMVKAIFHGTEFEVHTANSVEGAIERLNETKYSLVLLDWAFRPTAFRLDATQNFEGRPVLSKCLAINPYFPVVVMSSFESMDVSSTALESGAVSFLKKPLNVTSLIAHVRDMVRRYERTRCRFQVASLDDIRPLDEVVGEYVDSVVKKIGSMTAAATKLGITRQTLSKLIKKIESEGNRDVVPEEIGKSKIEDATKQGKPNT